jgi:putative membrane protein
MTKNINQAINLTSYFITLPPTRIILLAIIAVGALFGLLINVGKDKPAETAVMDGLLLLSFPALISSAAIKLLSRKMPYRRIAATALGGEIVYAVAYGISLPISGISGTGQILAQLVILVGSALVFVFWYVIARFIFLHKYRSLLFAMLQLLVYLIFLVLVSNQALFVTSESFINVAAKFSISAIVLMGALILFFLIINAPMKKNLGLSSTDAMSYLFSQWLYHNKDAEKVFSQVGEDVKTLIAVLGFKRKTDTVFFVTPYVHYGPFGNLGGSEFSYLIASEMDKKYRSKTFVFHGTVTHDLNPVATSEMDKILVAADEAISSARFSEAKVSLSLGKHEECRAESLRINDSAMIGLSRAPHVTEDVNFGLGLALMLEAEKKVVRAMVVDQHNAETGEITSFEPGSAVGFNYMNAIKDALAKSAVRKPLRLGVSFKKADSDVVGAAGIKVAILSSEPEYAVVLIDSNGVTPQFRDRIEADVKKLGESLKRDFVVGIFTTDTHQTNMVRGVLNPLSEEGKILATILEGVKEAASDMQDSRFFSDTRWFDIRVLGAKQSIEVISTVNSIVAVAKITLPLLFIAGILILLAIATQLR